MDETTSSDPTGRVGAQAPTSVVTRQDERRPPHAPPSWQEALQLASAVAGFAVFAYGVGAAIMWIRFWSTGFPADLALAAVPRERLAVLGLRSLLGWLILFAIIGVVLVVIQRAVARHSQPLHTAEDSTAQDARARRNNLKARTKAGVIAATLAMVISAFITWSLFTTVLTLVGAAVFTHWYKRRYRDAPEAPRWPLVVFVVLVLSWPSVGSCKSTCRTTTPS